MIFIPVLRRLTLCKRKIFENFWSQLYKGPPTIGVIITDLGHNLQGDRGILKEYTWYVQSSIIGANDDET